MLKKLILSALLTVLVAGAFAAQATPVAAFVASEHSASSERGQTFEIEDFSFALDR